MVNWKQNDEHTERVLLPLEVEVITPHSFNISVYGWIFVTFHDVLMVIAGCKY